MHGSHSFDEVVGDQALDDSDRDILVLLKLARSYSISRPSIKTTVASPIGSDDNEVEVEASPVGGKPKKNCRAEYSAWLRFWTSPRSRGVSHDPDIPEELRAVSSRTELVAFLTYWLGHDLFEYSKKGTIKDEIIVMATLVSRGVTYPLAPMFLGGLYRHLDVLVYNLRRANDETFTVHSLVPTAFLQVWIWAHFRGCCPKLKKLDAVREVVYVDRGRECRVHTSANIPGWLCMRGFLLSKNSIFARPWTRSRSSPFVLMMMTFVVWNLVPLVLARPTIGLMPSLIRRLVLLGTSLHRLLLVFFLVSLKESSVPPLITLSMWRVKLGMIKVGRRCLDLLFYHLLR